MVALRILIGFLPSLAWFLFYLHEDEHHDESKELLLEAFLFGAGATFLVLPVQVALHQWFGAVGVERFEFTSFLFLGGFEELFKFGVVYLFLRRQRNFTAEPIHVMIYMITAALGFAAVENIATALKTDATALLSSDVLEAVSLRFIGATLLHTLSSALVGYYWARALVHKQAVGLFILWGLAVATLLHASFNTLIIMTGPATYAILLLIVAAFFVLGDFERLKHQPEPWTMNPKS